MKQSGRVGDGVPFVPWALLWALAPAVTIVLLFRDIVEPPPSVMLGRDFTNLWVAGKLALSGNAACAFDVECFRQAMAQTLGLVAKQNYSYPPHALVIALPFAVFPYFVSLVVWTAAGVAFFIFCARPFLPRGFSPYLAAFTTAGWLNIWTGHYGFLLGGLWLLFFHLLDRHPGRAGIVAGLLTFKPHLGLMIAVTVIQRRTVLVVAIVTTAVAAAVSAALFGHANWVSFVVDTSGMQGAILTTPLAEGYFRMMPSAYVAFGRGTAGTVGQISIAAVTIWLLWRRGRWDAFSAATATFLVLPYSFNYDMTVACLGMAILLYGSWTRLSGYERAGLFLAFLSPQLTFYVPGIVPFALLYALTIQLRMPLYGESVKIDSQEWSKLADRRGLTLESI